MREFNKYTVCIVLFLLIVTMVSGCSSKQNYKSTYGIDQFVNEMKAKNYKFELKAAEKDFLPTTRRSMIIDKETIEIYIYNNDNDAENDAKRIDDEGCQYNDGNKAVNVSWISYPHFYKKGSIIVQYVGGNEKIISDLKNILGKQFSGYK
jgi:hypothetical protein